MKPLTTLAFTRAKLQRTDVSATAILFLLLATCLITPVEAGVTDLSDQPLATLSSVTAKPNLLFILDNSGSMGSAYMPDDMSSSAAYGYWSSQCNGLAYDPSITYELPIDSTGTAYANASITATKSDGYSTTVGSNIFGTSSFYYKYSGTQTKMGWTYTSTGLVSNTFSTECLKAISTRSPSTVFTAANKVTVTSTSTEAQNYANWYSYYRTRRLLMRTAMGRAISALDANYRVGFTTISDKYAVDGTNLFRDVKDFDSTQKANFYSSLYSATGTSTTPLRGALSKAGRYYANKVSGQTYDPMQYACQRNYALLSTDGYWNTGSEATTYGPDQLDGSTNVGDQDSTEDRPMKDDNASTDTLADVAEYYYKTDLRTTTLGNCTSSSSGSSQDVCSDIVKTVTTDLLTTQHMNTFTIGLGVSGTLTYDKSYLTQTTGSYVDLTSGTEQWPTPATTTSGGSATNVDDLWHAAVNGRGQYYSALSATDLSEAIASVVSTVQSAAGSGTSASTSTLELVAGTSNEVYRGSYTTQSWYGDLQAFTLDGATATIGTTAIWSAQTKLDSVAASSRKIYYRQPSATTTLRDFTYTNLTADSLNTNFDNLCSKTVIATQCSTLSTTDKALANTGTSLVNYLRGDRTHESASGTVAALYRTRTHVLGDIINGTPVYVGVPPFSYADSGYSAFKTAQASRKEVVYVAANDGMLHAFSAASADGGTELWAYVPTAVMPNLYKMADTSYGTKHQYYVDGAPVMADIQVNGSWKTIVVGGLNGGGKSYYALDITDPTAPKALWEFSDTNLGLTYGNPVIAKRADGTWIVAFASGYNNTGGDGKGHLYVVNANTGVQLLDISTTAGSTTDPSGLAKINAWVDDVSDNTVKRFYGGDLQGNLWRFDIDNLYLPNQSAMLLAKLQISSSSLQPITTKPITVEVSGYPMVVVATGRFLGTTDITDTTQQSIYGIKDTLTSTGWGDVRSNTANFVQQTLTISSSTATSATSSSSVVNLATKGGWWVDLPHSKERVVSDMIMQYGTLAVASAIPSGDACTSGGSSWRYFLDVTNGGAISSTASGALWSSTSLIVGMSWIVDSVGKSHIIYQNSDGTNGTEIPPTETSSGTGSLHRSSWRELYN